MTGITIKRKNIDELALKDNTEFQNLIDQVNGYKDPLTEKMSKLKNNIEKKNLIGTGGSSKVKFKILITKNILIYRFGK